MDKRKINIDRPKISSDEIQKGMDFQQILQQHAAVAGTAGAATSLVSKPWYQTGWFGGGLALTLVTGITLGVVFWDSTPEVEQAGPITPDLVHQFDEDGIDPAQFAFVNQPMQGLDMGESTYLLDASSGANILHETGTRITIPENAFVDDNGQVVTGTIEVEYIEYHDPADFFLSGIPMDYDSADTKWNFHSAGMMAINAFQNGKPVHANPDNLIEVAVASQYDDHAFNVYFLDTANRNWSFMGKDKVVSKDADLPYTTTEVLAWQEQLRDSYDDRLAAARQGATWEAVEEAARTTDPSDLDPEVREVLVQQAALASVQQEIIEIKAEEPQKPPRFNLDYDIKEFPELEAFHNLYFEIGLEEENNHFSVADYGVEWEDMKLEENEKGTNYRLTLTQGDLSKSYVVYPVHDGAGATAAMLDFNARFDSYQTKLDNRIAEEARIKTEVETRRAEIMARNESLVAEMEEARRAWEEERARVLAQMEEMQRQQMLVADMEYKVTRAFTVSRFGIWNCDSPLMTPDVQTIVVNFQNQKGQALALNSVYLVDHKINGVIRYGQDSFGDFKFSRESKNMVWSVTPEGKLAIGEEAQFDAIKPQEKEHTFSLKVVDREFKTAREVKDYLRLKRA